VFLNAVGNFNSNAEMTWNDCDAWSRALIQNGEFDSELSIRHLYEI